MGTVKLPILDEKAKEVAQVDVPEGLFNAEVNESAVHVACQGQRYSFYKKTATTKGRSEVSGGGKKMRKQKGGGCSRQGGRRGPQWVGGGIVFGPTGVKGAYKVNKKVRRNAMVSVLSDRHAGGQIRVVRWESEAKTKSMEALVEKLSLGGARIGFVVAASDKDMKFAKSARNLRHCDLLTEEKWTAYDFIKTDSLIFSEQALNELKTRFEKGGEG